MNFLEEPDSIPYEYVPPFYHELRSSPGEQVILEYPWQNLSGQTFDAYHHVHRGPVLVASVIDRTCVKTGNHATTDNAESVCHECCFSQ